MVDPKAEAMTAERFLELIGWFDGTGAIPTHDPIPNNGGISVPSLSDIAKCRCIVCEETLTGPVETHSIRYEAEFLRSYFYRIHKNCGVPDHADSHKAWCAVERLGMEVSVRA